MGMPAASGHDEPSSAATGDGPLTVSLTELPRKGRIRSEWRGGSTPAPPFAHRGRYQRPLEQPCSTRTGSRCCGFRCTLPLPTARTHGGTTTRGQQPPPINTHHPDHSARTAHRPENREERERQRPEPTGASRQASNAGRRGRRSHPQDRRQRPSRTPHAEPQQVAAGQRRDGQETREWGTSQKPEAEGSQASNEERRPNANTI